jgi:hypothetical protein
MENLNLTLIEVINIVNQLSIEEKEILLREIDVDIKVHLDAIEDYGLLRAMEEVGEDDNVLTLEQARKYLDRMVN